MARVTATERMRRVLAILPWIIGHGSEGASISEACARFGVDRDQLTTDLERVWMVGLYPYTPDRLIDVMIEGDRVSVRLAEYFSRPLRLTHAEALALIATGRSLTQVPGADPDDPLARGVAKLAAAMEMDADRLQVDLGEATSGVLQTIQRAMETSNRLELDYYSYGRDERATRTIEPSRLFAERGSWYLSARDVDRDDERIFRLDRIESASVLPERYEPPDGEPEPVVFDPGPDAPRIVLDLPPNARWVVDQYPVEEIEEAPEGHVVATLAVSGRSWLERLLLRLGSEAHVVEAPDDMVDLAPRAARRILARYA